jgi:hypothetical protein
MIVLASAYIAAVLISVHLFIIVSTNNAGLIAVTVVTHLIAQTFLEAALNTAWVAFPPADGSKPASRKVTA